MGGVGLGFVVDYFAYDPIKRFLSQLLGIQNKDIAEALEADAKAEEKAKENAKKSKKSKKAKQDENEESDDEEGLEYLLGKTYNKLKSFLIDIYEKLANNQVLCIARLAFFFAVITGQTPLGMHLRLEIYI